MQLMTLAGPMALSSGQFFRNYPFVAGAAGSRVPVDKILLHVSGEGRLLDEALGQGRSDSQPARLTWLREEVALAWPLCPARLGRVSSQVVGEGLHTHQEPLVLPAQLAALRARKPDKQHFRLALVNGFGTNLGDTLIGMTAFRCVAEVLGQQLPSFSVDVLLGPDANPANADLISGAPWLDRVLFRGPTLQDFAQYDGYFDVTGLINLPQYDALPLVDWYAWWFGLDPQAIAPEHKRNRGSLRWQAWNSVHELLRHTPGPKVLFNPKASVALRSMPSEVACAFAQRLLELEGEMHLVVDQPLHWQHERLLDLSAHIDSPEKIKALIAQVDGVVTVDTFGQHWADVCQTPCVTLLSVIEPTSYPYYPLGSGAGIGHFRALPAYKKVKVSEGEWTPMARSYHAAWVQVSAQEVMDLLKSNRAKKQAGAGLGSGLSLIAEHPAPSCVTAAATGKGVVPRLKRQRVPPPIEVAQQRLAGLAVSVLKPGSTVVLATPTSAVLALQVAQQVQDAGVVHIFEPRRILAQLLGGALAGAGVFHAQLHMALPMGGGTQGSFEDLDPWSESVVSAWGNTQHPVAAPLQPVDDLQLAHCHAVLVQPPMPFVAVIEGALETLKRCRPLIWISPISPQDAGPVCQAALPANYTFWADTSELGPGVHEMLLLGVPAEKELQVKGFAKVNLDASAGG